MTTDFARTLHVLKHRLADPTADAACETLLVAHQVGGTDLDRRLESLSDDRRQDGQGRKDARARQAGVRFARSFTIVCPLGMAVVGLTIGDGRAAYQTPTGQLVVLVALGMMAALRVSGLPEAAATVERVLRPEKARVDREVAWRALGQDKKAAGGSPRLVLLDAPGRPRWGVELPEADVRAALDELIA